MKMTKRILSILLTCALLCGILPWEHVNFVSAAARKAPPDGGELSATAD